MGKIIVTRRVSLCERSNEIVLIRFSHFQWLDYSSWTLYGLEQKKLAATGTWGSGCSSTHFVVELLLVNDDSAPLAEFAWDAYPALWHSCPHAEVWRQIGDSCQKLATKFGKPGVAVHFHLGVSGARDLRER